jgi:hypothetical protein
MLFLRWLKSGDGSAVQIVVTWSACLQGATRCCSYKVPDMLFCSLLTMIHAVATLNGATNVVRGGGLATVNEALLASSILPTEKRN